MKRLRKVLRLFFVWILVVFVATELLIRLWLGLVYQSPLPQNIRAATENPLLPQGIRSEALVMNPGFSGVAESTGIVYEINSWGFRDDEPDKTKKHVVFLGDSTTFGLNIAHEHMYSEVWERFAGDGWQAINTAMPGRGIENSYDVFERVLTRGITPHAVVLGFFGNDPKNDAVYQTPPEPNFMDMSYTLILARGVLDHLQNTPVYAPNGHPENDVEKLWHNPLWQNSLHHIGRLQDLANAYDARLIVLYIPWFQTEIYVYSGAGEVLERYTRGRGIQFINGITVYRDYLNQHNLSEYPAAFYSVPGDAAHPGVLSSRLLGQALAEVIP